MEKDREVQNERMNIPRKRKGRKLRKGEVCWGGFYDFETKINK